MKNLQNVTGLLAGPGGKSGGGNLINIDDDSTGASSGGQMTGQSKTQMLLEEEANLQELQDREKSIHQVRLLSSTFCPRTSATLLCASGDDIDVATPFHFLA